MKLIYQSPRGIGTTIDANYQTKTIQITNHTNRILDTAFGVNEQPTWADFETFLANRCIPITRDKISLDLKNMNLKQYNTVDIISKTEGRMAEDDNWLVIESRENDIER